MTELVFDGQTGSREWYDFHADEIKRLCLFLELPPYVVSHAKTLWLGANGASRAPIPLIADCVYICAKLSGNRVSVPSMKEATKELWGRPIKVLILDKRTQERRWVWDYKNLILSLYPDEVAWDDFVSDWGEPTND